MHGSDWQVTLAVTGRWPNFSPKFGFRLVGFLTTQTSARKILFVCCWITRQTKGRMIVKVLLDLIGLGHNPEQHVSWCSAPDSGAFRHKAAIICDSIVVRMVQSKLRAPWKACWPSSSKVEQDSGRLERVWNRIGREQWWGKQINQLCVLNLFPLLRLNMLTHSKMDICLLQNYAGPCCPIADGGDYSG